MALGYMPEIPTRPETEQLPPDDQGWIEKFKTRIAEFQEVFSRLQSIKPEIDKLPKLKPEYDALIVEGNTIQGTIDTVSTKINEAIQWFKSSFGMDAIQAGNNGQLGAIPLLPIAAISGVLAYIGSWIGRVYMFYKKLSKFDELTAQGVPPQEASRIVSEITTEPGIFGRFDLQKWLMPLVIIGGIWWFMRNKRL